MADLFGVAMPNMPTVNITGFFSNTWIYVLIIILIGFILIVATATILFFKTYKRKIIIFERGVEGLIPVGRTRARIIRLKEGGLQVMKLLAGGDYTSAYSKSMGKKTYWFERGQDGYLRNFTLGVDGKPHYVDGDMRMFHGAIDRYSQNTYGKSGNFEKIMMVVTIFIFLVILIGGMWLIMGKISGATEALAKTQETNIKVSETNLQVLNGIERLLGENPTILQKTGALSGLVPAS